MRIRAFARKLVRNQSPFPGMMECLQVPMSMTAVVVCASDAVKTGSVAIPVVGTD